MMHWQSMSYLLLYLIVVCILYILVFCSTYFKISDLCINYKNTNKINESAFYIASADNGESKFKPNTILNWFNNCLI